MLSMLFRGLNCQQTVLAQSRRYLFNIKSNKKALEALPKDPRERTVTENGQTFHPVFRNPYIVHIVLFSKFKIFLTASTLALGLVDAGSVILMGHEPGLSAAYLSVMGGSCVTLIGLGEILRKSIGFIYLSEDSQLVRLSRVTFFGNRKNFVLPLTDVELLTDTGEDLDSAFWKLRLFPDCEAAKQEGKYFYVVGTKSGAILDDFKFKEIFGNVDIPQKRS